MITLINNHKKNTVKISREIKDLLLKRGHKCKIISNYPFKKKDKADAAGSRLLIVIGGDGTILSTLSQTGVTENTPIIPIHFGKLGFISSIIARQALPLIKAYLDGKTRKFKTESRSLLEIETGGKKYSALNEVVITREKSGKLINLEAYLDNLKAVSFRADALILATATGSTAYNLAAAGPILHPEVEAMIFNPICPHSLTLKPLVIPGNKKIQIKVTEQRNHAPLMIIDGNLTIPVKQNSFVTCSLSSNKILFIKPASENFYATLKAKLNWGRDNSYKKN